MVNDNLNPEFVTPIEVDFLFEENQKFIMKVYDADDGDKLTDFAKQEFLGQYEFTLHKIVGDPSSQLADTLQNVPKKLKAGSFTIMSTEKKRNYGNESIQFVVKAKG